jgi:hypothetical protein
MTSTSTDAAAAFERAKDAIETGAISMIAPELGPLLIDDNGEVKPSAGEHIEAVRKLLLADGAINRMIASASNGARQIDRVMSGGRKLIYEEIMLIVSKTSQSFEVQRIAELIGVPTDAALMPDLKAVHRIATRKQPRLFRAALDTARSNLFNALPPSITARGK